MVSPSRMAMTLPLKEKAGLESETLRNSMGGSMSSFCSPCHVMMTYVGEITWYAAIFSTTTQKRAPVMKRLSASHKRPLPVPKRERRTPCHQIGRYLKSVIMGDIIDFVGGTVTSLNKSGHGLLLQMSRSFDQGDILEVTFKSSDQQSTTAVLEVRWSKPVSPRSGSRHYHVGCRNLISF